MVDFTKVPALTMPPVSAQDSAVCGLLRTCIPALGNLAAHIRKSGMTTVSTEAHEPLLWAEFAHQVLAVIHAMGGDAGKLQEIESAGILATTTAATEGKHVRFVHNLDKQNYDAKLVRSDDKETRLIEIKSTLCSTEARDAHTSVNFTLPEEMNSLAIQQPDNIMKLNRRGPREPHFRELLDLLGTDKVAMAYFDTVYGRIRHWGEHLFLGDSKETLQRRDADLAALRANPVPADPDAAQDDAAADALQRHGCVAIVACNPSAVHLSDIGAVRVWQLDGPFVAVLLALHYTLGGTININLGSTYCTTCHNSHRLVRLQAASDAFYIGRITQHDHDLKSATVVELMSREMVLKNIVRSDHKCKLM